MKSVADTTLQPGDYVIVAKGYHSGERNSNYGYDLTDYPEGYPTGDTGNGAITYSSQVHYASDFSVSTFAFPNLNAAAKPQSYLAGTFGFTSGGTQTSNGDTLPAAYAMSRIEIAPTGSGTFCLKGEACSGGQTELVGPSNTICGQTAATACAISTNGATANTASIVAYSKQPTGNNAAGCSNNFGTAATHSSYSFLVHHVGNITLSTSAASPTDLSITADGVTQHWYVYKAN